MELEKSNILLMGPTGSGNLVNDAKYLHNYFYYHMVVEFDVVKLEQDLQFHKNIKLILVILLAIMDHPCMIVIP